MIQHLKPYAAYKDSGMPWLGQVPEHWEVLPGRTVFREINDRGHPDEQMLSVTITRGVLRQADLLANSSKKDSSNEDKSNYKLVQPGDLVYNKMRAWQGAVGVSAYRGIVSPAYIVQRLRSAENLPRYMHFLLRTPLFASEAERWSYGITSDQWSLRAEEFKCIYFSLPPLPEQTAIVRFLDWAERRIRRVIRARQRRIKLLEEYRQTLINEAVTGKIDVRTGQPYPAYKPSGVEWLGEVPSHWEVVPIKRAFSSMDYGISESGSDSGAIRLLTMGHLKNGQVIIPDTGGVDTVDPNLLLSPGDLLFNRTNSAELVGKVALFSGYESPVTFASYLVRMRPTKENEPEFLNLVLNDASTLSRARREAIPSLHQSNLNPTRYGRLCIALPAKAEQQAILQRLREQTENIDAAIAAARREIELLREYRTRLISDVVTGKVDVREVAAQLPEEPPEEEAESMDADEIAEGETTDEESGAETLSEEVTP